MEEVMRMAGHYAAHAIWSVADGETLVPVLGFLDADNRSSMERLTMGSAPAFALAETRLSALDDQRGAVFIRDGLVELETGRTDTLILDVAFGLRPGTRLQLLIPYRHALHPKGFAVHCLRVTRAGGLPEPEIHRLMDAFVAGIDSHTRGGRLYRERYETEAGETAGPYSEEKTGFSPGEFELLKRSPVLVFLIVAAADGNVDQKELNSFVTGLLDQENLKNRLLNRIVTNVIGDAPAMILGMVSEEIDYVDELLKIRAIVDEKLSPEEAAAFKQALLALGNRVAAASGGFLGFGKVGREERNALRAISACLGLAEH